MTANNLTWPFCLGVVFMGCGGSAPPPSEPMAPTTAPTESATTAEPAQAPGPAASDATAGPRQGELDVPPYGASSERIMKAHFNDALLIRQAIIAGRPEDAANPATVIANVQNLEDLPAGWRPFVEDMQRIAQRITNGTTAATVAAAGADLGASCGACHVQHGGPKASLTAEPARGATVESRMEHHAWATDRLWDGLAIPAEESWLTGAKALQSEAFPAEVLKKGGVDARAAAQDFAKLVAKAPAQKTVQDRAALYAELLLTCGTCHRAVEDAE